MHYLPRMIGTLAAALPLAAPVPAHGSLASAAPPPQQGAAAVDEQQAQSGSVLRLSLKLARSLALENNLGLRIQALGSELARHNSLGSWGAFDWIFTGTGSYSDSDSLSTTFFGTGDIISSETEGLSFDFLKPLGTGGSFDLQFSRGISATDNPFVGADFQERLVSDGLTMTYNQPLLRGAWAEYATATQREAEIVLGRQRELERGTRQDLLLQVSNAYWDLVAARRQREVAQSSLGLGLDQVQRNQRRLEVGLGTQVEVLQAEAEVAVRREQLLLADVTVDQAGDLLKQLVFPGTDRDLWESIPEPTTPLPKIVATSGQPDWESALLVAMEQRPDLRQARADIDSAEVQLARSASERLAGLDLSLSANARGEAASAGDSIEQITDLDQPTYTAALTYSMPIGNRVARHAERAASIALRQARLTYDATESQVAALVRQAVRDVHYQAEAVRAAELSRELARQQLEAERARFDEGLSTNYQVLEFQQALAQTQSSERAARVAFAKAEVNMEYVQGLLGESPAQ